MRSQQRTILVTAGCSTSSFYVTFLSLEIQAFRVVRLCRWTSVVPDVQNDCGFFCLGCLTLQYEVNAIFRNVGMHLPSDIASEPTRPESPCSTRSQNTNKNSPSKIPTLRQFIGYVLQFKQKYNTFWPNTAICFSYKIRPTPPHF